MLFSNILEYPPYLIHVLDHCPQAAALYTRLWNAKDHHNKVVIGKKQVKQHFFLTQKKFNDYALLLVKEGLANVDETPSALHIELIDFDDVE